VMRSGEISISLLQTRASSRPGRGLQRTPDLTKLAPFQGNFLAKSRRIYIGRFEIYADILYSVLMVCRLLYNATDYRILSEIGSLQLAAMVEFCHPFDPRANVADPRSTTFHSLTSQRKGSGCKHPADLVYSLLEAITDTLDIVPDYGKQFTGVFGEAT